MTYSKPGAIQPRSLSVYAEAARRRNALLPSRTWNEAMIRQWPFKLDRIVDAAREEWVSDLWRLAEYFEEKTYDPDSCRFYIRQQRFPGCVVLEVPASEVMVDRLLAPAVIDIAPRFYFEVHRRPACIDHAHFIIRMPPSLRSILILNGRDGSYMSFTHLYKGMVMMFAPTQVEVEMQLGQYSRW